MQNIILSINKILEENTSYAAYRKKIKFQYPEIDKQLSESTYSYAEALYLFIHQLPAKPVCKHCTGDLKYIDRTVGYNLYCSHRCYVANGSGADKRRATCLAKYGVTNSLGHPGVREKRKTTMIKKYGSEFPLQNISLKEKSIATYKAGYSDEYLIKRKRTNLERYGVEHSTQAPEVMALIRDNNLAKYGVEWVQQSPIVNNKSISTRRSKFFDNIITRCPNATPLFSKEDYINVDTKYRWLCNKCSSEYEDSIDDGSLPVCKTCYPVSANSSMGEKELLHYIVHDLGCNVIENTKNVIYPKELDMYIPELNIAIEYNGLYWHSDKKVVKSYHRDKFLLCKEKNIQLIQIFEDEWIFKQDIVKSRLMHLLKKSQRICYARQCLVKDIDASEYRTFIEKHHIQGYVPANKILGAFFNKSLVAVMSFGQNRSISKNKGIELLRFATAGNIPGVAGKLFAYYVRQENPKSVFSYCDLRWGTGRVYEKLGMTNKGVTVPGYSYTKDGISRIHRYNLAKHKLVAAGADSALTESAIASSLGYYRIYDAGNYRFEWVSPSPQ